MGKSTDRDYVPGPNTARSEGGCLDKHPRRYHYHVRCNLGSSAVPVGPSGAKLAYKCTPPLLERKKQNYHPTKGHIDPYHQSDCKTPSSFDW